MLGSIALPVAFVSVLTALESPFARDIRAKMLLLVALVVVALAGTVIHRSHVSSAHARRSLGLALVLTVVISLAPLLLKSSLTPATVTTRVLPVAAVWAFLSMLPLAAPGIATGGSLIGEPRRSAVIALVVAAFALFTVGHWMTMRDKVVLQDEVLYLLQGRWMRNPDFGWSLDPVLLRFFRVEYSSFMDGKLHTQYPPGWPAILALFDTIGARWWTAVVLATSAVGLTYLIGSRVHSRTVGLVAAALLATQPWVLYAGSGYMSHSSTIAMSAAAAWLLLDSENRNGWSRNSRWLLAGAVLALLLATRPLTGIAIGISMVLWMLARVNQPFRRVATMTGVMAAGALPVIACLLYYNLVTNGDALLFGYTKVHGSLHSLGFGPRGFLQFDGADTAGPVGVRLFTPMVAIQHFGDRLYEFASEATPRLFVLVLLGVGLLYRFPFRWRTIAAFLTLPILYFFYFFTNIRFYSEILPVFCVGVAMILAHVASRNRVLARTLLIATLLAGVADGAVAQHRLYRVAAPVLAAYAELERVSAEHGKVLAFVVPEDTEAYYFRRLALANGDGWNGSLLIARDRGAENAQLIRRFPDRYAVRVEWPNGSKLATITPVEAVSQ
jgi:hypothetical protein